MSRVDTVSRAALHVVIVDPGAAGRDWEEALRAAGFSVARVRDAAAAATACAARKPGALIAALGGAGADAATVVRAARERDPSVTVIAVVGRGDAAAALEAVRAFATLTLERPVDAAALAGHLQRISPPRPGARAGRTPGTMVARSRAMMRLMDQVARLAPARAPLLIEGEAGAGKRRLARIIHTQSPRSGGRFIAVDGRPEADPERVLFGAEDHAPLSALELADGGTIYLEHLDHASPALQVRLLRVVQERAWEPPGGAVTRADVRLVASSERPLSEAVAAGRVRPDLFERFGAASLVVPPLRERPEDLPLLVREMLRRPRRRGRRVPGATAGVLDRLLAYDWPGNVRELEDTIAALTALGAADRPLGLADLPAHLRPDTGHAAPPLEAGLTVAEAERTLIAATLEHTAGDRARAAALLGIGLRTLYRKLGPRPRPRDARPKDRLTGGR